MTRNDPKWQKRWRVERGRGITRTIPSAPLAAHLEQLRDAGASIRAIADVAGVTPTAVHRIIKGQPTVKRTTATALMTVTMEKVMTRPMASGFVPSIGAIRRIQALRAIGWRDLDLNPMLRQLGCKVGSAVILHKGGAWISRTTHDAVAAVYESISMTPGPSTKTVRLARKSGYRAPLDWDDDQLDRMDQLAAVPAQDQGVDEVVVDRLARGISTPSTPAEKAAALLRMEAAGWTETRITQTLHIHARSLAKLRDVAA